MKIIFRLLQIGVLVFSSLILVGNLFEYFDTLQIQGYSSPNQEFEIPPEVETQLAFCDSQNLDSITVLQYSEAVLHYYPTWRIDQDGLRKELSYYRSVCAASLQLGRKVQAYEAHQLALGFVNPSIELAYSLFQFWWLWIFAALSLRAIIYATRKRNREISSSRDNSYPKT